ncbi:MAG: YigZ family protein [Flavobacteriales bacterium]|jgi:uncharacterized YigZ family protein|nr:YigZ family protein [Flavobacteriales bacterium]|tara:strand:+ start:3178 stop:3783 length:606 start_codon:yes stop_codon:yes gene_type:complete
MLFSDTYKEIEKNSKAIYKERGSKFISYSFLVYNESEIKKKLEEIKKKENGANHYCYAYRLHPDKSMSRFNDDGEPNSTAGRPIMKQIEKHDLTNLLIVVVRYFGGIKLGIPGLIRSYKTSTMSVLKESKIITKIIKEKYIVLFNHAYMNDVMRIIKDHELEIIHNIFDSNCKITFLVPKKKSDLVLRHFKKNHNLKITYN